MLALKLTKGLVVDVPVTVPPAETLSKRLPMVKGLLLVLLRSDPASVNVDPPPVTKAKSLTVVTLLLLNEYAGSSDVLVNVDPFVVIALPMDKFKKRLPMLNVLPLVSLKTGPARFTAAGPGVPGVLPVLRSFKTKKLPVVVMVLGLL